MMPGVRIHSRDDDYSYWFLTSDEECSFVLVHEYRDADWYVTRLSVDYALNHQIPGEALPLSILLCTLRYRTAATIRQLHGVPLHVRTA